MDGAADLANGDDKSDRAEYQQPGACHPRNAADGGDQAKCDRCQHDDADEQSSEEFHLGPR